MPPKGAIGAPPVRRERRHIPLLPLADLCSQAAGVKSVEAQRDVAAALYSLSIAEENKPAFLLSRNERGEAGEENSQPLETVIAMAASRDPDVRRSIAVSTRHDGLSMHYSLGSDLLSSKSGSAQI